MSMAKDLKGRVSRALSDEVVESRVRKLQDKFVKQCQEHADAGYDSIGFEIVNKHELLSDKIHKKFMEWLKKQGITIENHGTNVRYFYFVTISWKETNNAC